MRAQTIYTMTVASGAVSSTAVDLGQNWDSAWLVIKSMVSNSQHYLLASDVLVGVYRRVLHPILNTATIAAPPTFTVASALTNGIVPLPTGLRYIKAELTATADSGQSYSVIVSGG